MTGLDVSIFGFIGERTFSFSFPEDYDKEGKTEKCANEVIVTHPDTVDIGARVRLTDSGLVVEQWRDIDGRLDILGDERLRD